MPVANIQQIRFQTPAKINTFLFIQKKRADGYHELIMDLIPVSFYDTIELTKTAKGKIELIANLQGIKPEENLVVKATRIIEQEVDCRFSLKITLNKSIPSGAGLGGGSGNAAGMLKVLNEWYQLGLQDQRLKELALKLGADVPFFIDPKPSLAKGIGEKLIELPSFEPLELLLLNPGFPISTGTAYANCRISARTYSIHSYKPEDFDGENPGINDFWFSLVKTYPELTECRQVLMDENALFSGLSGSGSTLFGIFKNNTDCDKAFENLKSKNRWHVIRCKTLQNHNYLCKS